MALISENAQRKRLKQYDINIKTKYIVGNDLRERNTDNSVNEDIIGGIRCTKEYYMSNKLVHQETIFDSRIEYTYLIKAEENKTFTCPNCGMTSQLANFVDGCPYCRTYYNIDYTDKDLGSKYHYDLVLRSNTYRTVTGIIDIIISLFLSCSYIRLTARTFNTYDISKIFIYGFILALVLYYFFYIFDAYLILAPIRSYKEKQNQKQKAFWEATKLNKKTFFNNLNYEIGKYYYNKDQIIDIDVLDYIEFNAYLVNNQPAVKVTAQVRLITIAKNKIKAKYITDTFLMTKNKGGALALKTGANMIKCHNCGASIDATKGVCEYCHTPIKYLQEWLLEKE